MIDVKIAADAVRRDGVLTCHLGEVVGRPVRTRIEAEARRAIDRMSRASCSSAHVDLSGARPACLELGLNRDLLSIFREVAGESQRLTALHVRRDHADAIPAHLASWHVDAEHRDMVRMIMYLVDVAEAGAALEVVPRAAAAPGEFADSVGDVLSNPAFRSLSDAEVAKTCPSSNWRLLAGRAWSVHLVATGSVLHRVRAGEGVRWSMTYTYLPSSLAPDRHVRQPRCVRADERDAFGIVAAQPSVSVHR